jgi:hypothetical protein
MELQQDFRLSFSQASFFAKSSAVRCELLFKQRPESDTERGSTISSDNYQEKR